MDNGSKISWSVFPSEVEENILSRVPAESLMRFRCVCKHWCNLITKPHFIKMQLNQSTLTEEGSRRVFALANRVLFIDNVEAYGKKYVKMIEHLELSFKDDPNMSLWVSGSCNGLLFLVGIDDSLYLLNPVTKEYKKLPYPEILARKNCPRLALCASGFGYSPRTDEYKVVIIKRYQIDHLAPSEVCVYTLGTNSSWRSIKGIEYWIDDRDDVLVNGTLHWIARGISGFSMVAISFDLGDENFRELSLPKSISQEDTNNCLTGFVGLAELGGFLSLYHDKANENFYIWVMKDYGDEQSWTKQFSFSASMFPGVYNSIPTSILKKDEVILFEGSCFFIFDVVKKEVSPILDVGHLPIVYRSCSRRYVESLVSPRTGDSIDGSNKLSDWIVKGNRNQR